MKDPQIGVDSIVEKANNHLKYLIYGVKWVMRDYPLFDIMFHNSCYYVLLKCEELS